jgi:hypothetical protein
VSEPGLVDRLTGDIARMQRLLDHVEPPAGTLIAGDGSNLG